MFSLIETSALDSTNVVDAFEQIIQIYHNMGNHPNDQKDEDDEKETKGNPKTKDADGAPKIGGGLRLDREGANDKDDKKKKNKGCC